MGSPASQDIPVPAVAAPSATTSGAASIVTAPAGTAQPGPAPSVEFRPRAARAALVHSVMCRYAGATDFVEVTTLNISQSGMLFRGETLPEVGTELEFKFVLDNGFELLSGTAKVMRHATSPNNVCAAGVAFSLMDPPVQRILARVIEIHSEQTDDPS
jgi:PilZ domain-containing protein